MTKNSRIFVAGHRGLVGSAIVRKLQSEGYTDIVTRTRRELDLLDQRAVREFFHTVSPDYVFLAAARVGGIHANATHQAEFLYENLVIATNVIHAAAESGAAKLLFLGSSCIYPKHAPQPIREEYLLTGPLEPTNEGYAIAKIAGLKLCEYYRRQHGKHFMSAMPTNLYGPNDNFDPLGSHVIPGMMGRFHEAKAAGSDEVMVWGTGTPRREFLHVDDLADALYLLMMRYGEPEPINVGTGEDLSIRELAETMASVTGFEGRIVFDTSKPDGTPRKLLDVRRIRQLDWAPKHSLRTGLVSTYAWCLENRVFGQDPFDGGGAEAVARATGRVRQ
ncbi:MAG: GDP-L-fucose synthase family protein [Thermoanaerobaculia bacterium]